MDLSFIHVRGGPKGDSCRNEAHDALSGPSPGSARALALRAFMFQIVAGEPPAVIDMYELAAWDEGASALEVRQAYTLARDARDAPYRLERPVLGLPSEVTYEQLEAFLADGAPARRRHRQGFIALRARRLARFYAAPADRARLLVRLGVAVAADPSDPHCRQLRLVDPFEALSPEQITPIRH